ncbi:hypothetical protein X566_19165 [Afipia sp. P52-10]|nr:hypothetical protein X566_19165 [Afipia sp. P52-10]
MCAYIRQFAGYGNNRAITTNGGANAIMLSSRTRYAAPALDLLRAAFDLGRIAGQADVLDQRAALQRRAGALGLQILDEVTESRSRS